jgi:hypothetical protein
MPPSTVTPLTMVSTVESSRQVTVTAQMPAALAPGDRRPPMVVRRSETGVVARVISAGIVPRRAVPGEQRGGVPYGGQGLSGGQVDGAAGVVHRRKTVLPMVAVPRLTVPARIDGSGHRAKGRVRTALTVPPSTVTPLKSLEPLR